MKSFLPYYDVLGVAPGTDYYHIRKAFREKAKLFHPDINPNPYAQKMFIRIREAFEILAREYRMTADKKYRTSRDPHIYTSQTAKRFYTTGRNSIKDEKFDFTSCRQGKIIYCTVHIIFILIGLLIFIDPIITALQYQFDPFRPLYDSIFAAVVTMIFGIVMIWIIALSFLSFIRKQT